MTERTSDRANVREMYIVHRVFRREFGALPSAVRGVEPGDTDRASVVARHVRLIMTGLHLHHSGEDEILWPLIDERATTSAELTARMETQHQRLAALVADVERLLPAWEAAPTGPDPLAEVLESLNAVLLTHLGEEEVEILPLVTEHVSASEWAQLGEHARAHMRPRELPLMFGALLEECSSSDRALMLATLPLPLRLLAKPVIEPVYRRYIAKIRAPARADR